MREGKLLFHVDLNENINVLEAWKADKPQNIDRKWRSEFWILKPQGSNIIIQSSGHLCHEYCSHLLFH